MCHVPKLAAALLAAALLAAVALTACGGLEGTDRAGDTASLHGLAGVPEGYAIGLKGTARKEMPVGVDCSSRLDACFALHLPDLSLGGLCVGPWDLQVGLYGPKDGRPASCDAGSRVGSCTPIAVELAPGHPADVHTTCPAPGRAAPPVGTRTDPGPRHPIGQR